MIEFLATGFWTSNDISIRMKSGTAIAQKPKLEAIITFEHLNLISLISKKGEWILLTYGRFELNIVVLRDGPTI